ncbi:hypothetical protein NI17_013240 [Thermobifida halotolerans]|uniref:Uncharacterized protein n=1 Tax=Thermobifida halotolerans TaxID=483545 RepID=A0A399G1W3_9ACTN|nr:hypothetical protein [Thermobifida halotolerans]UOE17849.1 hypothetical protein NI17_013240 [Thermobifida halotolerans]
MLRGARVLLAMRDPLDAELTVSELLGSWQGMRARGVDPNRLVGEGLLDYARRAATPAALALLTGVSSLGASHRHRMLAGRSARELAEQGIARPRWAASPAAVRPVGAYVSRSLFGDVDELVCVYRHEADPPTGGGEHALVTVIDHNRGGVLGDAWVSTKVERLLRHCSEQADTDPMASFTTVSPGRAHTLLTSAVERTARLMAAAPEESPARWPSRSVTALLGFVRARARALPPEPPGRSTAWRRDRRATLAARFLASDAAADLSDSYAAGRCAEHIIDYGCDADSGRPLRVSPRKVETFLLEWLPRRVVLLPEEQEAMPHVLAAWIRWAGPFQGLPEVALHATIDAVWEATAVFTESYWNPSSTFGLRREVLNRLLPDGDLSALPRRMFAFPLVTELDEEEFDPATAAGRRALLRLDHFGSYDPPRSPRGRHSAAPEGPRRPLDRLDEEALAAHERLAERLWKGDPSNLWPAAQRLLDRGLSRSAVLEALLVALGEAEDEAALVKVLDEL